MRNALLILFLIPLVLFGQNFPEKSNRLVNDYTNTLSNQEVRQLEQKLVAYDKESSVQLAVVLINTLDGHEIGDYAFRLAEEWGVGQADTDNGALILVSMKDRKMWIATGYGLEGTLTDALSKRIVENEMKPHFRNNDYAGGLSAASDAIIQVTRGEYQGNGGSQNAPPLSSFAFIIVVFIIIWLLKAKQVRDYSRVNHIGFWAAWMLLNSSSRRHGGSWSSFSGGSGGFSGGGGFGGGSFGGGGAGGSW